MPLSLPRPAAAGAALALALVAACAPPPGRITPQRRAAVDSTVRTLVAREAQAGAATRATRAIGVTPFAVSGSNPDIAPLAYGLADLLTTDLARSHQVEIVDRLALDATLRELRLAQSGRVDASTAPRVGRIAGASRLVIGALAQPDPNTLGIETRVADVQTSQVQSALSATAPLVDVLAAEKALALRIFDQLGVTLTPAERAAVEQRQTQSLAALVAFGEGVRYELEGLLDRAAQSYIAALREDPEFVRAAQRLDDVRNGLLSRTRALDAAAGRINETAFLPTLGSAADPAFLPTGVSLIITINTGGGSDAARRVP